MKAVFDICGTLYDSNTTFDFCLWRARGWRWAYISLLRSLPMRALNKLLALCLHRHIPIRACLIATLKDTPRHTLEREAEAFVSCVLSHKKRSQVFEKLASFERDDVMLVSASIECVVKAIAKALHIPHYHASTLKYDEHNVCEGRIESDLLGRKQLLFERIDFLATDNLSDLALCQRAAACLIITKRKNKAFWLSQNLPHITIMEVS